MNQPSEERVQGGSRQWVCATCGLVLKEEAAPAPAPAAPQEAVLGRIPIRKISQPELAATKLAEEKAAAAKAAAAAVAAVKAAAERAKAAARAPAPAAKQKPQVGPEGLEFDQSSASDFEIEMGGEVKVISGTSPRAAEAFAAEIEFDQPGAPSAARAPALRPSSKPSAPPAAPAQPQGPAPAAGASLFDRVIVAEDSALLREMAKDSLMRAGLGQHVRTCADAMEMLQLLAESIAAGVAVDLIIIDIDMPVLSGHQAAVALRAFEKGLKAKPTPILFFTAFPCDERLKKVLDMCQPARYLNKGTDAAPDRIAARLVQVLSNLRRQG